MSQIRKYWDNVPAGGSGLLCVNCGRQPNDREPIWVEYDEDDDNDLIYCRRCAQTVLGQKAPPNKKSPGGNQIRKAKQFKVGDHVTLTEEYNHRQPGDTGTVVEIRAAGTVRVQWDDDAVLSTVSTRRLRDATNKKSLNEGSGTAGGYTVPPEFVPSGRERKRKRRDMKPVKKYWETLPAGERIWCGNCNKRLKAGDRVWVDEYEEAYCEKCASTFPETQSPPQKGQGMKKNLRKYYVVKCRKGYITKEPDTYSEDEDDAKEFDDMDEAVATADEEGDGAEVEEVTAGEEGDAGRSHGTERQGTHEDSDPQGGDEAAGHGTDNEMDEEAAGFGEGGNMPTVVKDSAKVLGSLHNHYKAADQYIDDELPVMDNPGVAKHLTDHKRYLQKAMDHIGEGFGRHHPDHDLDEVAKGLLTDGTVTGGESNPGEAGMVGAGEISPDDAAGGDMPLDAAGNTEGLDPDMTTTEVLERYQHPKSGKWMVRKFRAVRRGGRLYLVRKGLLNSGDTKPADPEHLKGILNAGDGVTPGGEGQELLKALDEHAEAAQAAGDFMDEMGEDEEVPKRYKSVLKHHSGRLGQVSKALTCAGKLQRNGGSGSTLTDEGTAGNKGSMKDQGQHQGKKPNGQTVVGSGGIAKGKVPTAVEAKVMDLDRLFKQRLGTGLFGE